VKASNGFRERDIVAWRFTKRQSGYQREYWVLSLSGNCWSNVDVSIDFSQQGMAWRGNFDLPPTSTFDPNSLPQRKMYKIHLN
jgi:hypothetical protein